MASTLVSFLWLIILGLGFSTTESRSTFKGFQVGAKDSEILKRDGSTSCSVGSRTYSAGQSIVFHNTTSPVEHASCTHCECRGGAVENCVFSYCDLGLHHGTTLQLCEQWLTEQNGECCPVCDCIDNGQRRNLGQEWVRRTSSGECHECSCGVQQGMSCQQVFCFPCNGVSVPVSGKCCADCQPRAATTPMSFTIELSTEGPEPTFPFPFPFDFKKKRGLMSRLQGQSKVEDVTVEQ